MWVVAGPYRPSSAGICASATGAAKVKRAKRVRAIMEFFLRERRAAGDIFV
jgi:hypothetical protein